MGTSYRKRKRLGPLPIWVNYSWSQARGSHYSFSFKVGPWTYNTGRKTSTIDLPGGFKHTHKHGKGPGTAKAPARKLQAAPVPYRPMKWPYAVLAVLMVLGVIGGAVWQSIVFFALIGLLVFAVQSGRRTRHAGVPVNRDAVTPAPEPIDYEAEAKRAEQMGAYESAKAWRELGGLG